MKWSRWFWFIAFVVLLRHLLAIAPSFSVRFPLGGTQTEKLPPPGQPASPSPTAAEGQSSLEAETSQGDRCEDAQDAVVTIFAQREIGSGSIVSPTGLVLTNHHVVEDALDGLVKVRAASGDRYQGTVIATDTTADLALVQLATQDRLPTVPLASPDTVQIGEDVCAIGSPFGRSGTLTRGKLTGFRGDGDLQSEILLYPGNSGGPLLNQQGEMIGINKSIWVRDDGENSGISFATRIDVAQEFILANQDKAAAIAALPPEADASPWDLPPISPEEDFSHPADPAAPSFPRRRVGSRLGVIITRETLLIQSVDPGSPAEKAGLSEGDRLVAVNGDRLETFNDLRTFLKRRPQTAMFTISRHDQLEEVQVIF